MSQKCVVCNKQAQYRCGHGCDAVYCGESCAKSVYDVHEEMQCSGLIGVENSESLIKRINYGSPQQTYGNAVRYYNMVKQQLDAYIRMNAIQKRFNSGSIQKSVNDLVTALEYVIAHRPDLSQDNMRANITNLRNQILVQARLAFGQINDEIGEGVADFNTAESYLRSFKINDPEKRYIIVSGAYYDVEDTYAAEHTTRTPWGKTKLVKKLEHFSRALTDLQSTQSNLSPKERTDYRKFVQQVDQWIQLTKK